MNNILGKLGSTANKNNLLGEFNSIHVASFIKSVWIEKCSLLWNI
jgi:hypothetical protein